MSIADKLLTIAENEQKVYNAGYAAGQAAGGGSVEGYATVTFHYTDQDGTAQEFSRLVMAGDDCPDPYVQNRIELPTKESTAQYEYTFNGWTGTDGGSADSNALKNITEDKVLYSAFAESVRMYTVNFYDGETLLHTEQVPYGGASSYEYSKNGYAFKGWSPLPTNVTGDMDCYGEWVESNEITDSWDEIIAAVNDGTYASKYAVGQYKPLDLGDEGVVNMQIVAFDTDKTDTNTVAITWIAKELLKNKRAYHSTATAVLFTDTTLYAWLNETLKLAMPSCVQSAIKPVNKIYKYATSSMYSSFTMATNVGVWLPSMQELNFTGVADAYSVDNCYSAVYTDDASRIKCINGTETPAAYMSRSDQGDTWNRGVSASGDIGNASKTQARGVCIGFCI